MFQIGDKVRLKPPEEILDWNEMCREHKEFWKNSQGFIFTVTEVSSQNRVKIDGFSDGMIAGYALIPVANESCMIEVTQEEFNMLLQLN